MKRIRHFVMLLVLCYSLLSCNKNFLEVIDKTVLLKEGYVVDLETTNQFLNGIYLSLAAYYVDGFYLPYPEIMADNLKPVKTATFSAAYNWDFLPVGRSGVGEPTQFWQKYYSIIRSCNFVIEKTDEFRMQNPGKADDLKGQALSIRAMIHFTLVNIFSQSYNFTADASHLGVPYIQTSDIDESFSRNTVAEVYTKMINDINYALQLLPKSVSVKEIMNYHAARALLARIYLFKEDYNTAKNLAVQVLKDVPVMITNYPANLYTANETEALFRMPPGASTADNYNGVFIGYYGSQVGGLYYVATNDIAQLLLENVNDKRSAWVQNSSQGWLITKFPKGITKNFPYPEGDYYQTLFRSSEMCLTAAEAYFKLNNEDSARYYIDVIRKRANPSTISISATGNALLDSICKERRKEMAFDGLRMFDLLRWKKGVNRLDASSASSQTLPYPSNKAIAPLPQSEIIVSGLPQNIGY